VTHALGRKCACIIGARDQGGIIRSCMRAPRNEWDRGGAKRIRSADSPVALPTDTTTTANCDSEKRALALTQQTKHTCMHSAGRTITKIPAERECSGRRHSKKLTAANSSGSNNCDLLFSSTKLLLKDLNAVQLKSLINSKLGNFSASEFGHMRVHLQILATWVSLSI
jgi:hypothetical protein